MKKLILLLFPLSLFGQGKISEMPSASSVTGTELMEVVQGGVNKKITLSQTGNTFYVPLARTLTINGTVYDLNANRSWSVGNVFTSGTYSNPSWITSFAATKITGTLLETQGGTGFNSYTVGDLLYASAPTTLQKLGIGTSGYALISNGITPSWQPISTTLAGLSDVSLSGLASGDFLKYNGSAWINRTSAQVLSDIGAQAPGQSWLLSSGGTATGTNNFSFGSNPWLITSGVTTGTGSTAGINPVFNSLTSGRGIDISSSSLTNGEILRVTSTSTALATTAYAIHSVISGTQANNINSFAGHFNNSAVSGGSGISVGIMGVASGASATNIGVIGDASGGTTNLAAQLRGTVQLNTINPYNSDLLFDATGTNTITVRGARGASFLGTSQFGGTVGNAFTSIGANGSITGDGQLVSTNGTWSNLSSTSTHNSAIKINNSWSQTTSSLTGVDWRLLNITPTANFTSLGASSTGNMYGIYYNPTLTGTGSLTHYAAVFNTGLFGIGTTSPTYKFQVKGTGTTTGKLFRLEDSAGTKLVEVLDNGGALIGSGSLDTSARLEIQSTTRGFLPPRMTGAQAEAISSPAEGLMIYSTDGSGSTITSKGWWGYDGTNWVKLN